MPQYTIRGGYTFKEADGSTKSGGQTIELDDEMAKLHADKIDPVQASAQALDAPADAAHE